MFNKAKRNQVKIKIAITGPSGSGKTYSALSLASGIGSKIAVIDTENGSASLYADKFEFDVCNIDAPHTTQKYIDAIKFAEKEKYDVLIIDSISHEWTTLMEQKTQYDAAGKGNSFTNWSAFTPQHNKFLSAFLNADLNIICCIRSKQEHILTQNDRGKQVPQKIGLQPIQRDGIEYEFTTVFDLSLTHDASVSKDRTGLFADQVFKITQETGEILKTWLETGEKPYRLSDEDKQEIINKINAFAQESRDSADVVKQKKIDAYKKIVKNLENGFTFESMKIDNICSQMLLNNEFDQTGA